MSPVPQTMRIFLGALASIVVALYIEYRLTLVMLGEQCFGLVCVHDVSVGDKQCHPATPTITLLSSNT